MTSLKITLNNESYKINLEENRIKRLERYIFSYVVDREGWQMAENIIENLLNAKNVNFHDPKFPFIDLIVKKNSKMSSKNNLINVKSSRKNSLRSAIFASLRGKNPNRKFLVSQINYILRSTNTKRAGDMMIGSKIVKSIKRKNFKTDLKKAILHEYNKAHNTTINKFDQIPTLSEKVSMCFIYNPTYYENKSLLNCSLNLDQTYPKTFKHLFERTLKKYQELNIADLIFYVFQEKNNKFANSFHFTTSYDVLDVKKIRKIYGLNGTMSNLKNDLINQIRDMGNVKDLRHLKKNISTQYL